eukprot:155056_1
MLTSVILTILLLTGVLSDKCQYPSSSDTSRTFDRLQADQETTLIPKICDNADGCGNSNVNGDVCARDPAVLTSSLGCAWCTSKNPDSCDPEPSNLVTDDDYYDCYSTTPESCGCVDNRGGNVAVLVDVTRQTAASFNYYLLFFSWWFSEKILPHIDQTNLYYIFFTDEIVYAGEKPYNHWDFNVDDTSDTPQPQQMDQLPDELKNKDQPNLCEALAEALDWFDTQDSSMPQLMYYIPFTTLNDEALDDCRDSNNDNLLDDITTFALRFWSETDITKFEKEYGFVEWCEYFQKPTYTPSQGNSPDTRYFVNTLSEFICADGGVLTLDPTTDPTQNPTTTTTEEPTNNPTMDPTEIPTAIPTQEPTDSPTINPTIYPTANPTKDPTENPTPLPTNSPTSDPTSDPTENPTLIPTNSPTSDPTSDPTENPTLIPTNMPTSDPTYNPTENPTLDPTDSPTYNPTSDPTENPTENPTEHPTEHPTTDPTENPTENPTDSPTIDPTEQPTEQPTENPTEQPTEQPTENPTEQPTEQPTENPTEQPTEQPTE